MNKNEVLKNLYLLLNVKKNSKNIKLTIVGGERKKIKIFFVQKCVFFALNVDEVAMIDNQKWISMHVYIMKNWVCTPLLLTFQWIEMGATIENIVVIILQNSIKFKGLVEEESIFWCICLRCDSDSMFQGHHTSIR